MWFIIALVTVVAFIFSALQPKQEQPKPQEVKAPVSDEGASIKKVYGTVWITDPMIVAFKKMGTDRIRTKGGKK